MAKTAIIEDIPNVREWKGDKGTVYYLQLVLDNGDTGSIGKKSKDALKIGDSLTYEIEETDKGNKIKEYRENGFGGGFGKPQAQGKDASFSLSYAKDLIVALIASDGLPEQARNAEGIVKSTLWVADQFNKWLKENN